MNVEQVTATCWSPSSRRAWIEIGCQHHTITPVSVALLAEGVDRNWLDAACGGGSRVALLAEGVDRNSQICEWAMAQDVALLAEGVDRNTDLGEDVDNAQKSPSSRRAWIEIFPASSPLLPTQRSPSSRRAWIEICEKH